MKKTLRLWLYSLIFTGVGAGIFFNEPLRDSLKPEDRWSSSRSGRIESLPPSLAAEIQRREARRRAHLHLLGAEWQSNGGIHEDLMGLENFISHAKGNSRLFAQEVLGWGTKWRFMADAIPGTEGDRHVRHIRGAFEEHFFAPEGFEREIERVVENYLARERQIENRMLVRIRADLSDLPGFDLAAFADEEVLKGRYEAAMERAMQRTTTKMQFDLTSNAGSLLAGEILAFVGVRMSLSAGILGTGAAAGVKTFGIGLVIAVMVDQAVSRGWDWYADPKGSLSRELNGKLDDLHQLIVHGDDEMEGLEARLLTFSRQRAELRKRALFELLETHVAKG